MDKETIINNLLINYGKYGITRSELEHSIDSGINDYDLSLEAIYSGLRMSLASEFNEHEYFSLDDVMAITGESRRGQRSITSPTVYINDRIRRGENKEILKEAIVTNEKKIRCPYCGKVNGMITGNEIVINYKIRCRGSKKNFEHYFILNVNAEREMLKND